MLLDAEEGRKGMHALIVCRADARLLSTRLSPRPVTPGLGGLNLTLIAMPGARSLEPALTFPPRRDLGGSGQEFALERTLGRHRWSVLMEHAAWTLIGRLYTLLLLLRPLLHITHSVADKTLSCV